MREGRLERSSQPLQAGNTPRIDARALLNKLEDLAPVIEGVLQAAGYVALTAGAVWLLFRFAP